MLTPVVCSRIEQLYAALRSGIDCRKIRTFVQVAPAARPTEIIEHIGTAMLASDNMLQVEGPLVRLLGKMAILTSIAGALLHEFARR